MKTSIVIPAYNAERYLAATVQSVRQQTISDWELVIVDDGSQDRTLEIAVDLAAQDSRVRVIPQANSGVAQARNRGFVESSPDSDCVCFLDSDDLLEPACLATLGAALQSSPGSVAAHGTARYIGPDGEETQYPEIEGQVRGRYTVVGHDIVAIPHSCATTFATLIVANCIVTPGAVLIRRPALAAAGEFDTAMSPCEDWDMWIRLSRLGDIAFVDQPVVAYRRHTVNASNDVQKMWRASDRVRAKATTSEENDRQQQEIARTASGHPDAMEYHARMAWAKESFSHGDIVSAAKQLRHAARARARKTAPHGG